MASGTDTAHAPPHWFTTPGEGDYLAWVAIVILCLAIYGLLTLYAAFDRWAEHKSEGTPLARTIPTLLAIALLYELFPLGHFNILLPIAAILIALMADWSRFHTGQEHPHQDAVVPATTAPTAPAGAIADPPASTSKPGPKSEAATKTQGESKDV